MYSWQRSFSFPVVTPGRTCGVMKSRTSEARRPATRMRCNSSGVFRTTAISLIMLEFRADFAFGKVKFPVGSVRVLACEPRRMLSRVRTRAADRTLKENGSVGNDASNAGSRGPFRTSDPVLEPEDGAVHLRPPQQDPHHQPREDPGAVPGSAQVRAPAGGEPRHDPLRRHQASGARYRARRGAALPDALRRPSLARRHA